jgi:hypothetical protein
MCSMILIWAASLPAASRVCRHASAAAKSAHPHVQPPPNW